MRTSILVALLLAGCAAPSAQQTPPPPEPAAPRKTISGTITTPRGAGAEGAIVRVRECTGAREWGAVADEQGHYQVEVESDCVTVEATAGGTTGRSTTTSLRLPQAPALTEQRAQELIDTLVRAIGGDGQATAALETYTPHHADALRVALENFRIAVGEAPNVRRVHDSLIQGFEYELLGPRGNTRIYVTQDDLHRLVGPVLYYSFSGAQYVTALARFIAGNDAERLARLLSPDDIDYPVEDARKLLARFQPRLDWARSQAKFVAIDDHTIRYELSDGTRTVPITLVYGDGLLSLRE
ncbi:MAG TPA: carboxypeptidase-like regulatory domain-containing protein [Thermoanaerobaculia bacterium]|nr:carboxypeptidase-like regulatory domain-containing protein [Thermoanaerobaculia bacterium]